MKIQNLKNTNTTTMSISVEKENKEKLKHICKQCDVATSKVLNAWLTIFVKNAAKCKTDECIVKVLEKMDT